MKKPSIFLVAAIMLLLIPLYANAGPLSIADKPTGEKADSKIQNRVLDGVLGILIKEGLGQKIRDMLDGVLKRGRNKENQPTPKKKNRPIPRNRKKTKDRAVYI